ncbi:HAMP domain-containing protein, partial [Acidobacteria bacterium ACD]|nr:HAMP domain-containing protein [Acidobacteria bacterium ACD]
MTLRLRLFALFGGLLALLVAAEAWLVGSLTRELSDELSKLAASVGSQVVRVVTKGDSPGEPPAVVSPGVTRSFVFAVPPKPAPPEGAPATTGERIEVHEELRWAETETKPAGTGPPSEPTPGRIVTTVEVRTDAEGRVVRRTRTEEAKGPTRFLVVTGPHVAARIPIPEAGVAQAVERFRNRLLLGSLGLCALGLAAAGIAAHRVSAPLRKLSAAARSVGEGRLGETVGASATGEVGEAIQAFDRMSARLRELEREAAAAREREHLGELGDVGRGLAHALRNPLHALG